MQNTPYRVTYYTNHKLDLPATARSWIAWEWRYRTGAIIRRKLSFGLAYAVYVGNYWKLPDLSD